MGISTPMTARQVGKFTIPMRGNECSPGATWCSVHVFTIPMRGNETTSTLWFERRQAVYDPHEG